LFLLGSRDEDIFVKVFKAELTDDTLFLALPSIMVEELKSNITCFNLRRRIRYLYRKQRFPYVILSTKGFKIIPKETVIGKIFHKFRKKT